MFFRLFEVSDIENEQDNSFSKSFQKRNGANLKFPRNIYTFFTLIFYRVFESFEDQIIRKKVNFLFDLFTC